MNTIRLPIDTIGMVDRLRELSEAHVEALASSLAERGLIVPVEGRLDGGHYFLVSGAHRLAAAASLGWTEIDAFVIDDFDDLDVRLREIDENLIRHDLNALDRAVFLAERKSIYEQRHPETKKGAQGGRGGAKNETGTMPFSKDTAAKLRLDETTIRRAVRIAERIPAGLRKRLAGTGFADKQGELLALANVEPAAQAAIVDLVTRPESPLPTIRAAIAFSEGRKGKAVDPAATQLAALQDRWTRAPAKVRKQFLDWLREQGEDA